MVDAWYEDEDGITVIDFKSDRVHPGQEAAQAQRHRPQLQAYGEAMEEILGRPVRHKVVWFFETGTGIEL